MLSVFQLSAQKLHHVLGDEDVSLNQLNLPDSCILEKDECLLLLLNEVKSKGYWGASIDSVIKRNKDSIMVYWYIGQPFKSINLSSKNIPDKVLKKYKGKALQNLSYAELLSVKNDVLKFYENNGYPFAQVRVSNWDFGNVINAGIEIDKQDFVVIDSIYNATELKISPYFLSNYLKIKKDEAYSEKYILDISRKIDNLLFVSETKPPEVLLNNETATVKTYLKKSKASRFDLVIGVLPKSNGEGVDITGDGEIEILNPFGYGTFYGLSYKSLQNSNKQFKSTFNIPYLPLVPLGFDFKFDIYLQDTTYRDINTQVALQYDLFTNGNVQFFYQNQKTALISIDFNDIIESKTLPKNLDISNSYYGAKVAFNNLNYKFNPQKGWDLSFNGAIGFKKIRENVQITSLIDDTKPDYDFGVLYDSLDLKSTQLKFDYSISRFFKVGKLGTLHSKFYGGIIKNTSVNKNAVFNNEQYRIGGYSSLRGFDEQSINADIYNILTIEYRYLLSKNSNTFLFVDVGNRINNLIDEEIIRVDYPYGFGVGANFETKAGIFGLSYALGTQLNNPILFKNGKIHFGYLNYF